MLIDSSQSQIEYRQKYWATRQGAADLLPALNRETLASSIIRIASVLGSNPSPPDLQEQPLKNAYAQDELPSQSTVAPDKRTLPPQPLMEHNRPPTAEAVREQSDIPNAFRSSSTRTSTHRQWIVPALLSLLVAGGGYAIWRMQAGTPTTSSPPTATSPPVTSGTITVAGNSFSGHSTFRSESFRQALEEAGIDLRYLEESDAQAAADLDRGKADLELTTIDAFLRYHPHGKIVGLLNHSVGGDAMVLNSKRYPGLTSLLNLTQLVEQARSQGQQLNVAFPQDTPSEYLVLLLATKFDGMQLSNFNVIKTANTAEDWKLLHDPSQNVAATIVREPDVTHARQEGYEVVLSSRDVPDEIIDVVVASDRLLQTRPDTLAQVLEAYYRRVDADVRDASQLKHQIAEDGKLSPADAAAVMQGIEFFTAIESRDWLRNGKLAKRIGATSGLLTLSGKLDGVPPAPEDLYTSQFIERAASNTEQLIDLVRASNPQLADKLAGRAADKAPQRSITAEQIAAAPDIGNLKVQWEIAFDSGSTHLTEASQQVLSQLAREISEEYNPQAVAVKIIGHTTPSGAAATNQLLSQQRAQEVVDCLKRFGLKHAILAEGKGSSEPLPGIPAEDPRNQRTEIRLAHIN